MERHRFVTHRGQRVFVADYSGLKDPVETLAHMARVQEAIEREPPGSVRYLVDVTGMHFDGAVLRALREYAKRCEPYFVASAVVGLSGLQLAAYRMITRLVRLELPAFATHREAMDWVTR